MKTKFVFAIAVMSFFISSCQKELTFEDNGGSGGGGTGDLLAKIVGTSGGETVTTEYEYDASKRLIREKIIGTSQGMNIDNDFRIVRNAAGIVTSTIQKNAELVMQGLDSAVAIIHYNTSTQRYTSRVAELSLFGLYSIDSTVFIYDASGKVIRADDYIYIVSSGTDYELIAVTEYDYGAGGVTETRFNIADFGNPGGPTELVVTVKYTYDTKTSPLILPHGEAAAILRTDLVATANVTKFDYIDVQGAGAENFSYTYVYTYNSKNKPATAVVTENPGNLESTLTYTYK
jgi:hypothetical protein